jgi:hypothetical protein
MCMRCCQVYVSHCERQTCGDSRLFSPKHRNECQMQELTSNPEPLRCVFSPAQNVALPNRLMAGKA